MTLTPAQRRLRIPSRRAHDPDGPSWGVHYIEYGFSDITMIHEDGSVERIMQSQRLPRGILKSWRRGIWQTRRSETRWR